jgi:hypothetical protein
MPPDINPNSGITVKPITFPDQSIGFEVYLSRYTSVGFIREINGLYLTGQGRTPQASLKRAVIRLITYKVRRLRAEADRLELAGSLI